MVDACIIRAITSVTTGVDGHTTDQTVVVYTGRCRLQEIFGFSRETNPSPDQQQLARYRVLQLPVAGSENVRVEQVVEMTVCVNDPDMVGVRLVVRDQSGKTEATSRRIGVEEMTG